MTNAADEESGENDENEIAVALAITSDGQIYISEDLMPEALRNGRKVFVGYALTPEEREKAWRSIHETAFNVSVDVFAKPKPWTRKPER